MAFQVNERVSSRLSGVFKDEAGNVLGSGDMTNIVVTFYDKSTGGIINEIDEHPLFPTGDPTSDRPVATLDEDGNFIMTWGPLSNALINATIVGSELHVILLKWTYLGGGRTGRQEIFLAVKNLAQVP